MSTPNSARRRFTPLQKEKAVTPYLAKGLTRTAVAQRLGIPVSSPAKWVRQARIDRGELCESGHGPLTREERAELIQPRRENRELRREKDFQAGGSARCQGAADAERFRLIDQLAHQHPIAWL